MAILVGVKYNLIVGLGPLVLRYAKTFPSK